MQEPTQYQMRIPTMPVLQQGHATDVMSDAHSR